MSDNKEWEIKGDWLVIGHYRLRLSAIEGYDLKNQVSVPIPDRGVWFTISSGCQVVKLESDMAADIVSHLDHYFSGSSAAETELLGDIVFHLECEGHQDWADFLKKTK